MQTKSHLIRLAVRWDPWVQCREQMEWFTWSTGIPFVSFPKNYGHNLNIELDLATGIFNTSVSNRICFPSFSTGRRLAGQGQLKSKPKDPAKRHHLFKKRFTWDIQVSWMTGLVIPSAVSDRNMTKCRGKTVRVIDAVGCVIDFSRF